MTRVLLILSPLLCIAPLASCASTPSRSPGQAGRSIADSLDRGDLDAARLAFEDIEESERHRDVAFSLVYDRGRQATSRGEPLLAASHFRFLAGRYPDSTSAATSLVYCLFLARAEAAHPSETLSRELQDALVLLGERSSTRPAFADLAEVQLLVDTGRASAGREALSRFQRSWDGSPPALRPYIEDLEAAVATVR